MSSAADPVLRIPVGVVVERRKAESEWIDFVWRAVGILPGEPEMTAWTILREQEEVTLFYVGSASIDLYRSEIPRYRDNLASGAASIWVVMSPSEGQWPYTVTTATADPSEGESFTEAATNLVEPVPMPDIIREVIDRFIAGHHVEKEEFVKRTRRPADPEALARRVLGEWDQ